MSLSAHFCVHAGSGRSPVCLWKQVHHSELLRSWSRRTSQDLKNASEHGSLRSRYRLLVSDWSSWRSKLVSSREKIQPRGSLQMGIAPTPNSEGRREGWGGGWAESLFRSHGNVLGSIPIGRSLTCEHPYKSPNLSLLLNDITKFTGSCSQ